MPSKKTIVLGKIFNPLSRTEWEYYPKGALIINAVGRLEAVGEYSQLKNTPEITKTLDYSDALILPGMIDTHIHLPQLPIRGKTAGTLLEWLNRYAFPVEEAFAESHYATQLSRVFFEALKANGTTTALVMSSVHEESTHFAFEAAKEANMRVLMGKVLMDQHVPPAMLETTRHSINASERLAKTWHRQHDDLLRYAFSPRYAMSCSPQLLEAVSDLCRRFPESYIHSHLSENLSEVEQVMALYGDRYTYTQIYEQAGCLGPRTVLAHGIHLSNAEMDMLQQTQTRIAHCPSSNFFLKSGFFNLPAYWERDMTLGLGSDIGAGPDLCLFQVMRAMDDMQLKHQTFVKPTEALYYGTLAGAETLSLETETGNLLPGKSADFIVVDTTTLNMPWQDETPIEETISQLVYLGHAGHIQKTYVRGKRVYDNPAPQITKSRSIPISEPLRRPLQTR